MRSIMRRAGGVVKGRWALGVVRGWQVTCHRKRVSGGTDLTPQGPALCAVRIHPPLQSNWRGEGGQTSYAGRKGTAATRAVDRDDRQAVGMQVTCSRKRVVAQPR